MEHNHSDRRVTFSVSWSAGGKRRHGELSFTPPSWARAALLLAVCALGYGLGLRQASSPLPAHPTAAVQAASPPPQAAAAVAAPGHVVGQAEDVITPLNVRDPTALVMGLPGR